jgi:hypothetical protein
MMSLDLSAPDHTTLSRRSQHLDVESGYHRQGTVESAFFRYKSIIGDRLRARHSKAQEAETLIACNILNGMTALGRPASYAIGF